jgi:tricorn protease
MPIATFTTALLASALSQGVAVPDAALLRYPDIGPEEIVFVFQNNLWTVPRMGGVAKPLTSAAGAELMPRYSQDGKSIAFVGNYDGNRDIYTIPSGGGNPFRVTHHPATEVVYDWTPDGGLVFTANGIEGINRATRLYRTKATGGLPSPMPVPYGANGTVSPDGEWLAYTPHSIDNRTWKRYRGGMQTDIWLFNLKTGESKLVTDWEGIDTLPMWSGSMLYYLSDRSSDPKAPNKLNIWSYDSKSGATRQVTTFTDDDVKWPSIGGREIVFQKGTKLMVLDVDSGKTREVRVSIPGDRPAIRPRMEDVSGQFQGASISPTGKRVAVAARGDVWTAPAENGVPINLSRSVDVAERTPAWSPDGKTIAFFDDSTGEYELYTMPADGKGTKKQLTTDGGPFKVRIQWSPDSKRILFADKTGTSYLIDAEGGPVKAVDKEAWRGNLDTEWSHDSNFITYSKSLPERAQSSIWIYDVNTGKTTEVTSGTFNDNSPTFDRAGDWLFFTSQRAIGDTQYSELDTSWVYHNTDRLYAVPLRKDVKNPWLLEVDEEKPKEDKKEGDKKDGDKKDDGEKKPEEKKDGDKPAEGEKKPDGDPAKPANGDAKPAEGEKKDDAKKPEDKKPEEKKPMVIDFDGFEARVFELPVGGAGFGNVAVNDKGHVIYSQGGQVKLFDLKDKKREAKKVCDGGGFQISADGKKLLVGTSIVDASAGATPKPIVNQPMLKEIDPKAEWKQLVKDSWRIFRDYFYDPTMHGVDWKAVGDRYLAMVDDANSREDVGYIISEMISELNVGHAYYQGRETERGPSLSVGMLGVDWELGVDPDGKPVYRFKRIVAGAPWDADARNPIQQLGSEVKEGEYLLAVNGLAPDTAKDPWAAFQGLAGRTVVLTVGPNPTRDDKARDVVIKPIGGEDGLRYRDWIEANRKYVAQKSDGKVGYIYVPNTGVDGQTDLVRQFQSQRFLPALLIDERWNGGGQIPTRFIELLNRPVTNYWARRDQTDWTWPPDAHVGPKAMLINGLAGSGGDMFPWLFKHNKLGPLVGTRTWGGLVGISGNPGLIDGTGLSVPVFAFYETDGTWGIEGHGVDPDFEVLDDPGIMKGGIMAGGVDPQVDKALELLMAELAANPPKVPARPKYPDRKGMGIAPEDK